MADQPHVIYGSVAAQVFTGSPGNAVAAVQVDPNGYLEVTFMPGVLWPCDLHWVAGVHILPVNAVNGTVYTIVPVGGTTRFVVAGVQSNALDRNLLDTIGWSRVETGDVAFAGAVQDDTVALTSTTTRRLRVQTDLARIANNAVAGVGVNGMLAVGGDVAVAGAPSASYPVKIAGQSTNTATVWGATIGAPQVETLRVDTRRRLWTYAEGPNLDDTVNDPQTAPLKLGAVSDAVLTAIGDDRHTQLVTDGWRRLRVDVEGLAADDDPAGFENPVKIGAVVDAVLSAIADGDMAQLVTDTFRRLYVNPQGGVADDAVDDATNPVKTGGVADAVLSLVTDGDRVQFVTDLYRRLQTVIAGYDSSSNANRTFEIAPLNLQVLEESLLDTTNHAVSAGISYPSDDGLVMMGYKDLSLTGKFICGADNTVTMTLEGTNDEDATPANRDWIVCYAYRTDTNAVVNSIACGAAATVTYGWDFDNYNYRYARVRLVITNTGALSNTIIIKIRRKAL